ncbi:MAG: hypothetical protein FJ057_10055 [Cyanobacteria bacterium K_DeepCast_0m_m1_088]|nr:hypothetical protein [Cyanobacteria bacterium K_DeepCast_0m_m1_088]
MVTASSLSCLRGLVLLGPVPARLPVKSNPSHRFQTDEHHDDVIPFRCTCRLDESPCSDLPLLERHLLLSELLTLLLTTLRVEMPPV